MPSGPFLSAAQGEPHEALYWVALTTGLRLGELFGLQWRDLDLKAGTLSVCRSQSDVKGNLVLKEPKTAKGRRQVTLGADVVALPWQHRAAMLAEGLGGAERVFCNTEGGPFSREQRKSMA